MTAPAVIEPRPFQFSGKLWTEATVMGQEGAIGFARTLVEQSVEFHHDPPASAGAVIHRFLVAAAPGVVAQLCEEAVPSDAAALTPEMERQRERERERE
jgi:hypothetical protein